MASRQPSAWRTVGFIAAILIPLSFVVNLYITSAIAPIAAVSNQSKGTSEANSVSIQRLFEETGRVARDFEGERSKRDANEREFETQIDAMNQALGVQFANQQRTNADFQNALHEMGAKYPSAPNGPWYFPNISNRNHKH